MAGDGIFQSKKTKACCGSHLSKSKIVRDSANDTHAERHNTTVCTTTALEHTAVLAIYVICSRNESVFAELHDDRKKGS